MRDRRQSLSRGDSIYLGQSIQFLSSSLTPRTNEGLHIYSILKSTSKYKGGRLRSWQASTDEAPEGKATHQGHSATPQQRAPSLNRSAVPFLCTVQEFLNWPIIPKPLHNRVSQLQGEEVSVIKHSTLSCLHFRNWHFNPLNTKKRTEIKIDLPS